MTLLIYIHGFQSSPRSHKASLLGEYIRQHHPRVDYQVPQLPSYPRQAAEYLEQFLALHADKPIGLVGSSLGGYYATWLLEQCRPDARAVLVNPAVRPYILLGDYLGEQQNPYTGEVFTLTEAHIAELKALDVEPLGHPQHYWLLQQEEDEVLDAAEAIAKYHRGRMTVEPGGDHSFQGFERYLAPIVDFLVDQP